jgi:Ca-activated chloride channel family protein
MSNKIDLAREALGEFFKTANSEDDYFVITFADRPQTLADATQSIGSIRAKLAGVAPGGHTALLDAIYLGLSKAKHSRYQRRALLIISDGGDNCSRYRSREIKSLVQESDVEIYAIGIFDSIFKTPEEWAGKRLLTDITEATGGHTVALGNARQLPEVAAAISLELRSQYILGYKPSNSVRDGAWRQIKVKLNPSAAPAPGQVYAKRGYLAPGK